DARRPDSTHVPGADQRQQEAPQENRRQKRAAGRQQAAAVRLDSRDWNAQAAKSRQEIEGGARLTCSSAPQNAWTRGQKHEAFSLAERSGNSKYSDHRDGRGADEDLQLLAGQLAWTCQPVSLCLGIQYDRCNHALLVRDNQEGQGLHCPQCVLGGRWRGW